MINKIYAFWENSSWLANLMTIFIGTITICGFIKLACITIAKYIDIKNNYSNIYSYIKMYRNDNDIRIKDRKIAIIDDQPENYPIDYLRKRGFNITEYTKVSLSNYSFIRDFDLLFLDITNVIEEDMEKGGFELIKRIRDEKIDIVVIGISSKRFDPTLTEFFKITDYQSKTPISEQDCEKLILDVLKNSYSAEVLSKNIDEIISEAALKHKDHIKLINVIIDYLDEKINEDKFNFKISKYAHLLDSRELYQKSRKIKGIL